MGLEMQLSRVTSARRRATVAIRTAVVRIGAAARQAGRTAWAWWKGLDPAERIHYRAATLLGIGFAMIALPLAFIVVGMLYVLILFGFSFRRS